MSGKNRLPYLLSLVAVVMAVGLLVGCGYQGPDTPGPTAAPDQDVPPDQEVPPDVTTLEPPPEPSFEIEAGPCEDLEPFLEPYPTTSYYVDCQVIVTGPMDAIEDVVREVGAELEELNTTSLAYLAFLEDRVPFKAGPYYFLPGWDDNEGFEFPESSASPIQAAIAAGAIAPGDVVMRLYRITSGEDSVELVEAINRVGNIQYVYADLNHLVGYLGSSPCANPLGTEGSPLGTEGSPGGGMGLNADPAEFWPQWAFDEIDLTEEGERSVDVRGDTVTVSIFDTSPWTATGPETFEGLALFVQAPDNLTSQAVGSTPSADPADVDPAISDHGLFVAGLINAVAPESTIRLTRVLDEHGCGDLYFLNQQLHRLSEEFVDLRQVVINLSLGVVMPEVTTVEERRQLVSLKTAIEEAFVRGAVIVAAAGNDSIPGARKSAELPAAYLEVIGVAASTSESGWACYTNSGEIFAPGGDAELISPTAGDAYCRSRANSCSTLGGAACPWAVVSLSAASTETGYAYWVGTSFATPLVSGLAALNLMNRSQGGTFCAVQQNLSTLDRGIESSGGGIINVPGSLSVPESSCPNSLVP